SNKRKKKAEEILEKVGAQNHINKPIGKLSGGELQRVLLAFALEPMPDILLLDEPVSAVDRKGISRFYSIITAMRKDFHMPVVLVSHDLGHVMKYATSYALMNHTISEIGNADNLSKSKKVREVFGLDTDRGDSIWK
ncbi:MAG: ATP-binding cassette domain-containing protein, partial [Clostridia bacterium]|nr:ATP-binding cassette domain-containing protein [Clostridia bacterium]